MSEYLVRVLLADFVRDPYQAKAFVDDPDGYLSDRGISLSDGSKPGLIEAAQQCSSEVGAAGKTGHHDKTEHKDIVYS